jgi:hypothetical protein
MKTIVYILLLVSTISLAQRGERSEKLKAYKTAFITEALDLSPAEAEKFWPVYNVYDKKLMDLRKIERKEIFTLVNGDMDSLSDEEANALLEKISDIKSKEFQYHQEMDQNLRNVISAKKILKLKHAEQEFKMKLLERVKEKHGQRRP